MTPPARRAPYIPTPKTRRSQLISVFGPGSIMDTLYDSVTLKGLGHWPAPKMEDRIEDVRLQSALSVDFFYQPPPYIEGTREDRLPALKFPRFHYCPSCHQLTDDFLPQERKRDGVRCTACKKTRMVPARFVAACSRGHAQDFPFREWSHSGLTACAELLSMLTLGKSASLRDIRIQCDCGKGRSMEGAFSEGALKKVGVGCAGLHLWRSSTTAGCDSDLRALQRGASNFYFAETMSSLLIPPWEGKIADLVRRFRLFTDGAYPDSKVPEHTMMLELALKQARYTGLTTSDVFDWTSQLNQARGASRDPIAYKEEEFRAFSRGVSSDTERPRFLLRSVEVPDSLRPFVQQLVLADVLEEVRALIGFRRIDPWSDGPEAGPVGNLVEIREDRVTWWPGGRLTGEGIFV